ncbi:hypothetical protein H072_5540 [Dactylellina haptotyla CBS 200.50]|uniref:F-box domain-containing protein n=1 Tax=Dactylellina haptotyla (strain CBS 200.50) TaxID=1284197 RepID=S8BM68_DACHA|nr:hypothetical protein H072_5540 [Dactylellina haptotyla CBS 200.50]
MTDLLTLPVEIRLTILENLLVSKCISEETGNPEVWPYSKDNTLATREEPNPLQPQILRTCKKLYSEGVALLYSKNRFCIHSPNAADDDEGYDGLDQTLGFLRGIGTVNTSLIRWLTIGGGAGMLKTKQLQECFQLANKLTDLTVVALGPRCKAPYSYMLQYYLNIEAAARASSTLLTEVSSAIPNGFVPEGFSVIHLKFHRQGARLGDELEVKLDESIAHFREQVREQEKEWKKQGWNLPIMFESTNGLVAFV